MTWLLDIVINCEEGSQPRRLEHGKLRITRISRHCHWGHWPHRVAEKSEEVRPLKIGWAPRAEVTFQIVF